MSSSAGLCTIAERGSQPYPVYARGEIDAPRSLVDLPASLLALLGVSSNLPGRRDLLQTSTDAGRPDTSYAETSFRGSDAAAVVAPPHKLIWLRNDDSWELFDLVGDPGETRDLSAEHPKRREALGSLLHAWLEAGARARAEAGVPAPALDLPPETLEQLRALGYGH